MRFCQSVLILLLPLIWSLSAWSSPAREAVDVNVHQAELMRQAACRLLDVLGPELREQAAFALDGAERLDWHFIPKDRVGVSLKEMDLAQRQALHALLRTALSAEGYLKATSIMRLEEVLRLVEHDRPDVDNIRDPEKYWIAIFGHPAENGPWGWRFEGHHLSLNFSSVTQTFVASTPAFFGANPAEVRLGPVAGLRVLAAEEDLARELMARLGDDQRRRATISAEAPRDVITGPGHDLDLGRPAGLPAAEMTPEEQDLLWKLVKLYAGNLKGNLARSELDEIRGAGREKIHFAWAGSLERGQGHYYRIHGPTFIIEYDNTQNDANHIHTVWHSTTRDFALDALKKHYAEHRH
jgi:hypothetical protein